MKLRNNPGDEISINFTAISYENCVKAEKWFSENYDGYGYSTPGFFVYKGKADELIDLINFIYYNLTTSFEICDINRNYIGSSMECIDKLTPYMREDKLLKLNIDD